MNRIAKELSLIAKELSAGYSDLSGVERRFFNELDKKNKYLTVKEVIDAFARIRGVKNVQVSDGERDDTYFTVKITPQTKYKESYKIGKFDVRTEYSGQMIVFPKDYFVRAFQDVVKKIDRKNVYQDVDEDGFLYKEMRVSVKIVKLIFPVSKTLKTKTISGTKYVELGYDNSDIFVELKLSVR